MVAGIYIPGGVYIHYFVSLNPRAGEVTGRIVVVVTRKGVGWVRSVAERNAG